jgi:serine/threonine kinase 32
VASPSTCQGYNFAVDWWSLGVTAFELKSGGARPFEINQKTSVSSAIVIFEKSKNNHLQWSSNWSPEFTKFMAGLLTLLPDKRTTSLAVAKKTKGPFISGGDFWDFIENCFKFKASRYRSIW